MAENRVGSHHTRTPNYSILLGSGASVSSGIRSGGHLINFWKQEIFDSCNEGGFSTAEEFFMPQNAPEWYNDNSAYSSLFEERYALPRQRRIFVENEVSGKTPSIGYAYLVKLIENGYFNTVFTTNFDDLLNEAFYRFSQNRPIVCAHDSSISGITITSSRPKIIKLHGDYLFDNIKATEKETKVLEANMKLKFQEFAKDFGLIVVGYSGNDKSIMDILSNLLDSKEYFKNGIFWCIRKGDVSLSADLQELLLKDRVFLVEIDGFDELFAELNYFLNNGILPIDDTFLSMKHQEQIINDLTDTEKLNLKCKFLGDDCKRLKDKFEGNLYVELLNSLRRRNSDFISSRDKIRAKRKIKLAVMSQEEINDIRNLSDDAFLLDKKEEVLNKLKGRNIYSLKDSQYKLELLEIMANLGSLSSDEEIKKCFDELIRLNPDNQKYYEIAANRSVGYNQKTEYLHRAVERFPNDKYILNVYVDSLLDHCENHPNINSCSEELSQVDLYINKSLNINSSISNYAYFLRLRWIKLKHINNNDLQKKAIEELCTTVRNLSLYHPNTIKILGHSSSHDLKLSNIEEAINFYQQSDDADGVEDLYRALIEYYLKSNEIKKALNCFQEFEDNYESSYTFKMFKVEVFRDYEYFEDALVMLSSLPFNSEVRMAKMSILAHMSKYDKVNELYAHAPNRSKLEIHFFGVTKQYDKLIGIYTNKLTQYGYLNKDELIQYAFALLKMEKYEEVMKLLKPYYDNPNVVDGSVIVNYLYAKYKMGEKIEKIKSKVDEKLFKKQFSSFSDMEKLGGYCIAEDVQNIIKYLSKVVKSHPAHKYLVSDWTVMEPFKKNPRILALLQPSPQKL